MMNIEEWLYRHCVHPGRGWRWGLYLLVARLSNWWSYASRFECWTLYVASFLVGGLAGLVLATMIRGG